jgi:hypothetical protein
MDAFNSCCSEYIKKVLLGLEFQPRNKEAARIKKAAANSLSRHCDGFGCSTAVKLDS